MSSPKSKESLDAPRKRTRSTEAESLRQRAKRVGVESRATVSHTLRLRVDLYRVLVELAEEYHLPISTVAIQCIEDGARKYRDFARPGGPFNRPPMATLPALTERYEPQSKESLVARLAAQARRGRPVLPVQRGSAIEDTGIFDHSEETEITNGELLGDIPLGALFPQSPPLVQGEETNDEQA